MSNPQDNNKAKELALPADETQIAVNSRVNESKVDELFLSRYSTRNFLPGYHILEETLDTIFEAAKWSPSCYNDQPWFFLCSHDDESKNQFLSLLVEANQKWAKNASNIIFVLARKDFMIYEQKAGEANSWAEFDAGAAWMSLALQAKQLGLYTHAMAGVKYEEAYKQLSVDPDKYRIMCAIAIGARQLDVDEKITQRTELKGVRMYGKLSEELK
jgi:nitroreductase